MRIGKHKDNNCNGEFIATCINNDTIIEITCNKCGFEKQCHIIPKWKKELIEKFNIEINNEKGGIKE